MATNLNGTTPLRLRPSAAKRDLNCAGAAQLIQALELEGGASEYSAMGNVAHNIAADCLRTRSNVRAFLGRRYTQDGFCITVDENMVDAVGIYVDIVLHDSSDGREPILSVEIGVDLSPLNAPGYERGTLDASLYYRAARFLRLYDYKHGEGVEVAGDDPQFFIYTAGELLKYPSCETVEIIVVQPRHRCAAAIGPAKRSMYTREEIFKWVRQKLIPGATACQAASPPLSPSVEACQFCPAKPDCPARYAQLREVLNMVKQSEIVVAGKKTEIKPGPLTPAQKVEILENADLIKSFISVVEKSLFKELSSGSDEYQGQLKLVHTSPNRKFNEHARDELTSPLFQHLVDDDIFTKTIKGIGEIEKSLKNKLTKAEAAAIMKQCTFKPPASLTVVKWSDKREEVKQAKACDVFKHLIKE